MRVRLNIWCVGLAKGCLLLFPAVLQECLRRNMRIHWATVTARNVGVNAWHSYAYFWRFDETFKFVPPEVGRERVFMVAAKPGFSFKA